MLIDSSGRPLGPDAPATETRLIGITRRFSMKLNLGNYESAEFFASERAECSPEMAEEVSRDLDEFCKDQVLESIRDFKARRARKEAEREKGRAA